MVDELRIRKADLRPQASIEPIRNGTDLLRATVKARNKSPNALSVIAREVNGLAAGKLEDFGHGKAELDTATLQKLTKILYPHSEFDAESGMLRPTNRTSMPLGIVAGPFIPDERCVDMIAIARAPKTLRVEDPKVKETAKRPGWLDSLFGA